MTLTDKALAGIVRLKGVAQKRQRRITALETEIAGLKAELDTKLIEGKAQRKFIKGSKMQLINKNIQGAPEMGELVVVAAKGTIEAPKCPGCKRPLYARVDAQGRPDAWFCTTLECKRWLVEEAVQ